MVIREVITDFNPVVSNVLFNQYIGRFNQLERQWVHNNFFIMSIMELLPTEINYMAGEFCSYYRTSKEITSKNNVNPSFCR